MINELAVFLLQAYDKANIATACCIDVNDVLEELTVVRLHSILMPVTTPDFIMYCRKDSMLDKHWRGRKEFEINKNVDFLFRVDERGITYG